MSGRDNIFLNASLLGLSRREIERSFDEIVAFAELEPFIDNQVRFYSSGMYVRLGFSVASTFSLMGWSEGKGRALVICTRMAAPAVDPPQMLE